MTNYNKAPAYFYGDYPHARPLGSAVAAVAGVRLANTLPPEQTYALNPTEMDPTPTLATAQLSVPEAVLDLYGVNLPQPSTADIRKLAGGHL